MLEAGVLESSITRLLFLVEREFALVPLVVKLMLLTRREVAGPPLTLLRSALEHHH